MDICSAIFYCYRHRALSLKPLQRYVKDLKLTRGFLAHRLFLQTLTSKDLQLVILHWLSKPKYLPRTKSSFQIHPIKLSLFRFLGFLGLGFAFVEIEIYFIGNARDDWK